MEDVTPGQSYPRIGSRMTERTLQSLPWFRSQSRSRPQHPQPPGKSWAGKVSSPQASIVLREPPSALLA